MLSGDHLIAATTVPKNKSAYNTYTVFNLKVLALSKRSKINEKEGQLDLKSRSKLIQHA